MSGHEQCSRFCTLASCPMHRFRIGYGLPFPIRILQWKNRTLDPSFSSLLRYPFGPPNFSPHLMVFRVCSFHRDTVSWQARLNPKDITHGNMDPPQHCSYIHTHHKGHSQAVDMDGSKSQQTKSDRKASIGFSSKYFNNYHVVITYLYTLYCSFSSSVSKASKAHGLLFWEKPARSDEHIFYHLFISNFVFGFHGVSKGQSRVALGRRLEIKHFAARETCMQRSLFTLFFFFFFL